MKKPKQAGWRSTVDKVIRLSLFLAYDAGKKQCQTPYKYTLDTDKIGKPVYEFIMKSLSRQRAVMAEMMEGMKKKHTINCLAQMKLFNTKDCICWEQYNYALTEGAKNCLLTSI